MKRGKMIAISVTALSTIGLAAGLTLATTATASATATKAAGATKAASATKTATATKTAHPVVLNCSGRPVARPSTFSWTCADYGMGVQRMHWTSWTSHLASGYGTLWENDCTPNCASGHIHHYTTLATLWGSATVKGHPAERRYTRLTLVFPGRRPPLYILVHGKVRKTYPLTQTFRI